MAKGPEAKLVAQIVTAIEKKYPSAWVRKIHGGPYQHAGIPDLLVCVNGILVGLEAKALQPGESEGHARARATIIQTEEIKRLHEAGAMAGVVLSVEEALELVDLAAFRGVAGIE